MELPSFQISAQNSNLRSGIIGISPSTMVLLGCHSPLKSEEICFRKQYDLNDFLALAQSHIFVKLA